MDFPQLILIQKKLTRRDEMNILFTDAELKDAIENPKSGTGAGIGLYRNGYRLYGQNFWGMKPGSEVLYFLNMIQDIEWNTCSVLEIGAGTGKNIIEFVRRGIKRAVAVEIDSFAVGALVNMLTLIEEAELISEGKLAVIKDDVFHFLEYSTEQFDIVICYGLLHVFKERVLLQKITDLISKSVKANGYLILQSLTDKYPAPTTQGELEGVIVTPEFVRQSFKQEDWELVHWNEDDIFHSHIGSEVDHHHGSVRAIIQKLSAS